MNEWTGWPSLAIKIHKILWITIERVVTFQLLNSTRLPNKIYCISISKMRMVDDRQTGKAGRRCDAFQPEQANTKCENYDWCLWMAKFIEWIWSVLLKLQLFYNTDSGSLFSLFITGSNSSLFLKLHTFGLRWFDGFVEIA